MLWMDTTIEGGVQDTFLAKLSNLHIYRSMMKITQNNTFLNTIDEYCNKGGTRSQFMAKL